VLNVSDPDHPTFVGQHQLPYNEERKGPYIISGLDVTKDYVVITSPYLDARVIAVPGIAMAVTDYSGRPPEIGPRPEHQKTDDYQAHYLGGQVYGLACEGDIAYVAAGQGGLHVVQVWPEFNRLRHIPSKDRVLDVDLRNGYLYVAEGTQGMAIWRQDDGNGLSLVGRYSTDGEFCRQVIVPEPGRFAVLIVGPHSIHVVDLQNPETPKRVSREYGQGILTGDNIADGIFSERFVGVYWHKSGNFHTPNDRIRWYDLHNPDGIELTQETTLGRIDTANGVAVAGDKVLMLANNGYRLIDQLESRKLQSIPVIKVPGTPMIGKPPIHGNRLYVSHRPGGEVFLIDIEDFEHPRLIHKFVTSAHPARVVPHPNCLLIPGGYEGLLIYHLKED
jgi:hypothetical protein